MRKLKSRITKAERRETKKRPRMRVSGRGVFVIQRLKAKRHRRQT